VLALLASARWCDASSARWCDASSARGMLAAADRTSARAPPMAGIWEAAQAFTRQGRAGMSLHGRQGTTIFTGSCA